jgi:hypothetical protein
MSETKLRAKHNRLAVAAMAVVLVLGYGAVSLAGPPGGAGSGAAVKFEPTAAAVPIPESRLDGVVSSIHVAGTPQGSFYAATDKAGKARVWLLRNNVIAAELTVPPPREKTVADWPGSLGLWLGGLPVVAISWKLARDGSGTEDFGFWAVEGNGRSLGGLPRSIRSACPAGDGSLTKDCGRCTVASNVPIDARLAGVEQDRARFVQQIAANFYSYFAAAAEIFEQDYLLTARGLVPDGPARRTRNVLPQPQAKERIKPLLRDYFKLAKSQSRPSIAPEFLTCFEQLVELAPEFGQGHYNVGCMHALLGNAKQAVAAVTKALSLSPEYRKLARKDPDLESVRDDPEIVRLLGEAEK